MKDGSAIEPAILDSAPERPAWPWLYWGIAASFFCFGFFLRVSPSVMVQDLMRDFQVSGVAVGSLSAFYFYAYSAAQLPAGMMHDRFGPRRVLSAAVLVVGAACLIFATAPAIGQAYVGRLLTGLGCSFAWLGTVKLIAIWFPPHRFALLTGMTVMVGMGGAVGGQMPLALLVESIGWRATLVGGAGFSVLLGLVIWGAIRDGRGGATGLSVAAGGGGTLRDVAFVLRNPQTWANSIVCAAVTVPLLAFAGLWGVPYMMAAHGLSRPEAAAATSLILIGWGAGAPSFGWLSDRIRRRKPPILAGAVVAYTAILTLIYVPDLPMAVVYALLLLNGFAGASSVICYAAGRENNPPQSAATSVGIVNMAPMFLSAAFQPLIGWLLDLRWDGGVVDGGRVYSVAAYQFALSSLVGCAVVGLVVGVFLRETRCQGR